MYSVNIKVIRPEWFEYSKDDIAFFESIREPEDLDNMKYGIGEGFEFTFPVLDYTINKNRSSELEVQYLNPVSNNEETKSANVLNVSVIEFRGEAQSSKVIISNEIIYGEFSAQKSGRKTYLYIYLDGRVPLRNLGVGVWLSEDAVQNILNSSFSLT